MTPLNVRTFLTAALLTAAAPAAAQSGSLRLDAGLRTDLVSRIAAALAETYVEADTGRMIGDVLRRRLAEGAYDALDNPTQFADAATRDLRSINGDLHLGLRYSPAATGGARGGGPGNAAEQNFGLGRAEILDGNIGYLEITGFMGAPGYRDAVTDALRFLSRADALIIDVRRNPGGSGEMSHYVFSHFFGAEPVPTIRVKRRGAEPVLRESFAEVAGPRRTEVPLYVLTSQGTGSAAEEFSFVLKNRRRATIVGSRTAGAGHMVTGVPVGNGFSVGISITRVMDAVTGAEWEGSGVQPDLQATPAAALDVALEAALTQLAAKASPARRPVLERLAATARARRAPQEAMGLDRLVGDYGGRQVSLDGGRLLYARRAGALAEPLVQLEAGRFALGATHFVFEVRGAAVQLRIEQPDGTTLNLERATPPA